VLCACVRVCVCAVCCDAGTCWVGIMYYRYLSELFRLWDHDGSGRVDLPEFCEIWTHFDLGSVPELMAAANAAVARGEVPAAASAPHRSASAPQQSQSGMWPQQQQAPQQQPPQPQQQQGGGGGVSQAELVAAVQEARRESEATIASLRNEVSTHQQFRATWTY